MSSSALRLSKRPGEHPIPHALRPVFSRIASAFRDGNFRLLDLSDFAIEPNDAGTAAFIAQSIQSYGEPLVQLQEAVWEGSCYLWQDGHWDAIVDLSTEREDVSDLALHVKIYAEPEWRIVVWSVHVP